MLRITRVLLRNLAGAEPSLSLANGPEIILLVTRPPARTSSSTFAQR